MSEVNPHIVCVSIGLDSSQTGIPQIEMRRYEKLGIHGRGREEGAVWTWLSLAVPFMTRRNCDKSCNSWMTSIGKKESSLLCADDSSTEVSLKHCCDPRAIWRAADVVGPGTSVALIELITVYWPHSRHKKLVSLVSNKSSWQALSFKILLFFLSPLYEKLWVFLTNWHFGRLLSINGVRHHQTHVSGFSRPRLAPHYLRCIS